jgi:hypothetical protein
MLPLLGNRKLNTSMDTLTNPVLLRCMANNSRKASVSIGPAGCCIKEARDKLVRQFRKDIRVVEFRQRVARDQFSARIELFEVNSQYLEELQ